MQSRNCSGLTCCRQSQRRRFSRGVDQHVFCNAAAGAEADDLSPGAVESCVKPAAGRETRNREAVIKSRTAVNVILLTDDDNPPVRRIRGGVPL